MGKQLRVRLRPPSKHSRACDLALLRFNHDISIYYHNLIGRFVVWFQTLSYMLGKIDSSEDPQQQARKIQNIMTVRTTYLFRDVSLIRDRAVSVRLL